MSTCTVSPNNDNNLLQYLSDVDPTGLANGDVPTWNDSTQKFEMTVGGGGGGSGTVTSVSVSSDTLTVTGSPITTSGTIDLEVIENSTIQKIQISESGTVLSTRSEINFIEGTNVTIVIADDIPNDRANVTINASGGGGGEGTVSSVAVSSTDLSITGSPITTSGTIVANINNNAVTTTKIADSNVTLAKLPNIANKGFLARYGVGTGAVQEGVLGASLGFNTNVLDVQPKTTLQNITVANGGSDVGTRSKINLIAGSNISYTVADDSVNDRVNITINSSSVPNETVFNLGTGSNPNVNWNNGRVQNITLNGNFSFGTITNEASGGVYSINITADGTNRTINLPTGIKAYSSFVLTATYSVTLTYTFDGTNRRWYISEQGV